MTRVAILASCVYLMCAAGPVWAAQSDPQSDPSQAAGMILPAGTKIELAVIAPVWARTAKMGDSLYTRVDFPVLAGKAVAIPPGTYVQATILSVTRPSRFKSRAEIQALFTTLIFANGYAVQLPSAANAGPPASTIMKLAVNVSSSNDLLLDNGAQFTITLAAPVALDTQQLAAVIAMNRPVDLGQFRSATLCRPTPGTPGSPGTPGTPDTVIPGSPGTPSITIPGGPGMPDTVIPGTPATPPTVIPGTPGTPGTPGFPGRSCPPAPIVVSSEPVPAPASPSQSAPQNP